VIEDRDVMAQAAVALQGLLLLFRPTDGQDPVVDAHVHLRAGAHGQGLRNGQLRNARRLPGR
jgi:hypothetical protein